MLIPLNQAILLNPACRPATTSPRPVPMLGTHSWTLREAMGRRSIRGVCQNAGVLAAVIKYIPQIKRIPSTGPEKAERYKVPV